MRASLFLYVRWTAEYGRKREKMEEEKYQPLLALPGQCFPVS